MMLTQKHAVWAAANKTRICGEVTYYALKYFQLKVILVRHKQTCTYVKVV